MCREGYNYIIFEGVSMSPNALEAVREQAPPAPAPAPAP
eukprot:SAG11_NODE_40451_length_201_cov_17.392157_1_plen_38_part_10